MNKVDVVLGTFYGDEGKGKIKDCIPVYEEFIGDFGDIYKIKNRDDLPSNAKIYLNRIEELVGTPIKFIGTGPGRDHIIIC